MPEPPDNHRYSFVLLYKDTFNFYAAALKFYEELLDADLKAIEADPDLRALLPLGEQRFAIHDEIDRIRSIRTWMEEQTKDKASETFGHHLTLAHGAVRVLKSVGQMYLKHLRQRREFLAARPHISRNALAAIDQQISNFESKTESGVFKDATPIPMFVTGITEPSSITNVQPTPAAQAPMQSAPVLLTSIEILDSEISARCLDLFAQFRDSGQHDRLDTVVTESTRILEDRLRGLSGAAPEVTGVDLANYALGTKPPRIALSSVDPEQQAAHLLFRGVFGFIRNSVHHKLVGDLKPERVLQIVGMIDYLVSLLEGASSTAPPRTSIV